MRLFVAVALPAAERQRLALIGGGVPGARWLPAGNLHLTLRFIGEADGHAFQDITAALQEIDAAAFDLRLSGVGYFGDKRRVRVLWAGVDGNDELRALQQRVETALVRVPGASHSIAARPSHLIAKVDNIMGWFKRHDPADAEREE